VKDGALDDERIAALLAAMRAHSVPVKPQALGVVGKEHFKTRLASLGGDMETSSTFASGVRRTACLG
jgi:hypothetical protein